MKSRILLSIFSAGIFLAAAGFTRQQPKSAEPTAETQFKNIQIFKGMPASVVRPAMDGITAALGVRCGFCHVQDAKGQWQFEKDDKDEKKTAREMFTMMNKINADSFGGRMVITCATCHQGHSSPNRIPPIGQPAMDTRGPGGPNVANDATMPKADDLLAKYMSAIGGDAVGKVTTLTMKGKMTGNGENADVTIEAKAPDKVRSASNFKEGLFTQGFDGTTGWQKFSTFPVEVLNGSELDSLKRSTPFYVINPKAAYPNFRRVRKDTLDGKDVYVVDVQPQDNAPRIRLYFDANTGLLSRVWTGEQTVVGIVPSTDDYSDYRDVSGVKVPFMIVSTSGGGVFTTTFSDVKTNVDIPDSEFSQPK